MVRWICGKLLKDATIFRKKYYKKVLLSRIWMDCSFVNIDLRLSKLGGGKVVVLGSNVTKFKFIVKQIFYNLF